MEVPPALAEKILRQRAGTEGERRTVTVLFVDAEGSTAAEENVDPEETRRVVSECTQLMVDAVHRFEGTVTQFRGDGILALFGAPIAHEDSARRAVSAALAMRDAVVAYAKRAAESRALAFRYRFGLHTGPVVVGRIADDLSMDYTAIGDTVNLAARIEESARPDSVYVSGETYQATSGYFEYRDVGAVEVRGRSGRVRVYEAIRELPARTRLEITMERGLTPFTGRRHELQALEGYLELAARGQGQVVFVSGEAGIGKSRLLWEFRERARHRGFAWVAGQCISYGKKIPYLPVLEILKRIFGVEENDDAPTIGRKIDERAATWSPEARAIVPYLKYLLAIDPGDASVRAMDPMERRAGVLGALRLLLAEESRRQPLVLAVEDLHWVDERSEEVLAAIADVVASLPVLAVLTYRPGYAHSLGERTHQSRLSLGPLPREESLRIVDRVLGSESIPREVREFIARKAEGNPLYVEEVAKALVETGVLRRSGDRYTLAGPLEKAHVPDTVQGIILARIDRLAREAKAAIQLASVIGREFTVRLLDRISDVEARIDEALRELKGLELVYEKAYFPELSYMFKHALTHEVAYSTLLVERRRALHRTVGAAIEELYADRLPEHYETLAHHYAEGQDWEKALEYLEKAGEKAAAHYANGEALDLYGRAFEVCAKLGCPALERAYAVAHARSLLTFALGEAPLSVRDFERLEEMAKACGRSPLVARARAQHAFFEFDAHHFEEAEVSAREALRLGEKANDRDAVFLARVVLLALDSVLGRRRPRPEDFAEIERLSLRAAVPIGLGQTALFRVLHPNWAGDFDGAIRKAREQRERTLRSSLVMALFGDWSEALAFGGKGEYAQALEILHRTREACERVGELQIRARVLNTIGWIHGELQDHDRAIEWNRESLAVAAGTNRSDPEFENNARLNLADSLLALGRMDEAEEFLRLVEPAVRSPRPEERWMLWRYSQHYFHTCGELWLARGVPEKAAELAAECLALAERTESRKNVVKARRLQGQVFFARGELDEAQRELGLALGLAENLGNPPQLWRTCAAVGDLRRAQGRTAEAREAYARAFAVIESVAHGLPDEALRRAFLDSPHVRRIQAAA